MWSSVFTIATLFILKTYVYYKPIDKYNIIITVIGVPMVENNLTFMGDQKLGSNGLNFVNGLFILKMDTCFISVFIS